MERGTGHPESANGDAAPAGEEKPVPRLPIVGVMGSGADPHRSRSEPLGRALAREGVHLLTGGGGGVMEAVSRSFHRVEGRIGSVIAVIPGEAGPDGCAPFPGYPNPWVEIPIATHLPLSGDRGTEPLSRNHINVLSADVIVALPGGPGTASELRLALRYGRPVIAFVGTRDEIPGLPPEVPMASDLEAVLRFLRARLG